METKDLLFTLAILILLILTLIFGFRSATNRVRAEAADALIEPLTTLLISHDYPRLYPACRTISRHDINELQRCLEQALKEQALEQRFRQSAFKNANPAKNETGYLIIENERGGGTFESEKFLLSQNNKVVVKGCATSGPIKPGYTCRFDLTAPCQPGDNLEVTYDGKRAFLKTC